MASGKARAWSYLTQAQAQAIDELLMDKAVHAFSIDQLMELAGLSCAAAIVHRFSAPHPRCSRPLVVCGPGNNGGDGLVAARHLKQFGWDPIVWYPTQPKGDLYPRLLRQCRDVGVRIEQQVLDREAIQQLVNQSDFIVDAVFGFSFKGALRSPFDMVLSTIKLSKLPVVSIDIPSGWDVEQGNVSGFGLDCDTLISLTAPKLCAKQFTGWHYLGGRFVPDAVRTEFDLHLPQFQGADQYILISQPREWKSKANLYS
jgi:NAD(P)H-hydrate epimerase